MDDTFSYRRAVIKNMVEKLVDYGIKTATTNDGVVRSTLDMFFRFGGTGLEFISDDEVVDLYLRMNGLSVKEVAEIMAERDYETLEHEEIIKLMVDGCAGWKNMDKFDLYEHYKELFNESHHAGTLA